MQLLASWLSLSVTLYITALIVPGFRISGIRGALVVGAIFGLLNWAIGWFIFGLIGISTLLIGFLFAFVTRWIVNAILLKLTDAFTDHMDVDGFGTALIASAVLSLVSAVLTWLFR
jgi:putative membrane protein